MRDVIDRIDLVDHTDNGVNRVNPLSGPGDSPPSFAGCRQCLYRPVDSLRNVAEANLADRCRMILLDLSPAFLLTTALLRREYCE